MSERVKCPICHHRIFDKEENARGFIVYKCSLCKNTFQVNLATLDFHLVQKSRKAILPRKKSDEHSLLEN